MIDFPGLMASALCLTAACVGGCTSGFGSKEARQAELAGEYHRAYDLYCHAAATDHGNRMLGFAIARVAPQAAAYWEDRAHRAIDQSDYAEAWRLFVKVLEIRPDHPSAPHLIRRLERDHPTLIEPVKMVWLKPGRAALAMRPQDAKPGRATSGSIQASPRSASNDRPRSNAPLLRQGARTDESTVAASSPPVRASTTESSAPNTLLAADPARRTTGSASGAVRASGSEKLAPPPRLARIPNDALIPATASEPTERSPSNRPGPATSRPAAAAGLSGQARPPTGRRQPPTDRNKPLYQYLTVRTLSKKDRRFPRKAEIIDGLIVEIRDTDDDPDADFYVYIGSKRIAKHKGVRIGEARQVPGRSGRAYDLVLLAVIDSQQTIRLGVRPASPAPRARR